MTTVTNFIAATGQVPFVLQCTVIKNNASNLSTVEPDETIAILKVDEVFKAPEILGNIKGKSITVKLTNGRVRDGQKFILSGRQWQYSNNIALIEIDRTAAKIEKKDFKEQVINMQLQSLDEEIIERIKAADLIVSGKVLEVEKVKSKEFHKLEDKAEDWFEARTYVLSIEKGKLANQPEVNIRFPGVESEKRYGVPKFKKDQEGIWFLHIGQEKSERGGKNERTGRYFLAPTILDFHLLNQLSRIRALIKKTI